MKKLLIVAIVFGLALQANAQVSRFLDTGKSGLGIQALGGLGEGYQSYGGRIGGSYKGILDAEFLYTHQLQDGEFNHLITDQSTYGYYEGRLTWWMFRKPVSPALDVNLGLFGLFETGLFKDYLFINSETGLEREYKRFVGGTVGFEASVNFRLNEHWSLQPSVYMGYDLGQDLETESGQDYRALFSGAVSVTGAALTRKMANGSVFYALAQQHYWTYGTYFMYEVGLGYIFAF